MTDRSRPLSSEAVAHARLLLVRFLTIGWLLACMTAAAGADQLRAQAETLHRTAIVVDGHNDITSWIRDLGFDLGMDGTDPRCRTPWLWWLAGHYVSIPRDGRYCTHTDLRRMRAGGLDAQFFSIWSHQMDAPAVPGVYRERALAMIASLKAQVAKYPDALELATTAADIRRIASAGRTAVLLGLEGGHAIEDDLEALELFHAEGVRYMTLVHQHTNGWADSASDADDTSINHHGGLAELGHAVVLRMNDLGIAVDVSHGSDDLFWDVLATTRAPVMASHSSARALAASPRNLSDDMLRAVAANGGIVMVNFGAYFLDARKVSYWDFAWLVLRHPLSWSTPLATLVDHIEHVAHITGIDHVGLGSDFDGVPFLPDRMGSVADLPNLTEELLHRGWSDGDVRRVLGENVLRVLVEVAAAARGGGSK